MLDHWFWLIVTMACVAWYMTITVFVAFKGFFDIKTMFTKLAGQKEEADGD